jgi:cation diffusion facilitator CzcD-associated flavoprotein CzcO
MLPETPLHPSLYVNAPVPFSKLLDILHSTCSNPRIELVTCPHHPFPRDTPLFAKHDYVLAHQKDYVSRFGLSSNIYLNHTVLSTSWVGNSSYGHWNVTTLRTTDGTIFDQRFDHIIVATGNEHYPHLPTWEGLEGWLANTPPGSRKRDVLHSIYFRDAERYRGRTVVVVGGSFSGRDVATQISHSARKVGPVMKT